MLSLINPERTEPDFSSVRFFFIDSDFASSSMDVGSLEKPIKKATGWPLYALVLFVMDFCRIEFQSGQLFGSGMAYADHADRKQIGRQIEHFRDGIHSVLFGIHPKPYSAKTEGDGFQKHVFYRG